MYYQQQNKSHPKGVYLPILKLYILNFNLSEFYDKLLTTIAHTNFWLVCAFPFFL